MQSVRNSDYRESRVGFVAAFILFAFGAIALVQSYGRWLDPIIDVGRDLYIPEQIRHGLRLYVDISYLYPPLAPHLLAIITAITGSSLTAYTAIGICVAAVIAGALFAIGSRVAGTIAGFSAALLFVTLNFAGATSWGCNFLFPYAHAATFGMMFLLVTEWQLIRGARLWAILFALLATWSKLEFAVAVLILLVAAAILRRIRWLDLLVYIAANTLVYVILNLWFRSSPHWFRANILAPSLLGGGVAREFYRQVTGLANLGVNLRLMIEGFLLVGVVVVALGFVARTTDRARRIVLYGILAVLFVVLSMPGDRFFRAWAIAQLALIPFAIRERQSPLPMLLVASLLMSSRIFFRLSPEWYGFVYTIPTYVLIAYVLFRYLPERNLYTKETARAWLALFLLLGARGLFQQNIMYSFKSAAVATRRGTYLDLPHRADVMQAFLRWSDQRRDLRTLAAVPEGLTLNYFTGKRTSFALHTFTPAEMPDRAAEDQVIREFVASPPDAVALVSRNMGEFGFRGFGIDYGRDFASVIEERYEPAARWESGSFWIVVLTRRTPPS